MKRVSYLFLLTSVVVMLSSGVAVGQEKNTAKSAKHTVFIPAEMDWQDGPKALPAGTQQAVLEGNPAKSGPFTLRIKFPANYKIPAHWHSNVERVTIITGTLHMGTGDKLDDSNAVDLPMGSFTLMPAKMHHYAWTGDEETVVQLHGIGPWNIHYLDPKDDPRKS